MCMRQIFTLTLLAAAATATFAADRLPGRAPALVSQYSMRAPDQGDDLHSLPLVDELPEGVEAGLYSRDSRFYARDGQGKLYYAGDYGLAARIALTEDKAYIASPYAGWPTDTWLCGDRDGDKVTVTFPQLIYFEEYPDWDNDPFGDLGLMVRDNYYAYKFILEDRGETSAFIIDSENPAITFTIGEDGSITQEGDCYIGMVGEYRNYDENGNPYIGFNWMGFADGYLSYSVFDAEPVVPGEDVAFEQWVLDNSGVTSLVGVAMTDEGDVYLKGLYDLAPYSEDDRQPAVIHGRRDGDKVVLEGGQYLGIDRRSNHFAYFVPGFMDGTTDEGETVYIPAETLELAYDAGIRELRAADDASVCVSSMPERLFLLEVMDSPVLTWQDMSTPMVPVIPEIVNYDWYEDFGFGVLMFNLSDRTDDGRLMDVSRLYYNIVVDDEDFVFYPDEYWSLEEPMTYVPYEYWDDSILCNGDEHEVLLYMVGFDNIGVRASYHNADGTVTYSQIGWLHSNGVETLQADEVSVEWYDLHGHRLEGPVPGVSVRRAVMSDGRVVTGKYMTR